MTGIKEGSTLIHWKSKLYTPWDTPVRSVQSPYTSPTNIPGVPPNVPYVPPVYVPPIRLGYGADANDTGDPIGGGVTYSNIITSGDYAPANKVNFLANLAAASSGEVVYIAEAVSINLSGEYNLTIPEGVTIASNRGQAGSLGGLLYWDSPLTAHYAELFLARSHVKFNGIRLRGPDSEWGVNGADPLISGITCSPYHALEVENCEIYNWPYGGIVVGGDGATLASADKHYVHHNYIHHNRRNGLGYGVQVGAGAVLVEANIFNYGRHFISGDRGLPAAHYEARYNYFEVNCTNTMVDCHGGNDISDASSPAGGQLLVHHNTFKGLSNGGTGQNQPCVGVRGVPTILCDCYRNWTYYPQSQTAYAFHQNLDNLGLSQYQKMMVHDNWFGTNTPPA